MTGPLGTPEAFTASVRSRLKTKAVQTGRRVNELEREFVMQAFLSRVFADPESPWILKGGSGLLVRLPGARHSIDLDLLNTSQSLDDAVQELHDLGQPGEQDPFVFIVERATAMQGGVAGTQLKVDAMLGRTRFARFPIDLSTELTTVARPDRQAPAAVINIPGLRPPPVMTLYPLPDQVADKVCALYEHHGPTGTIASTRYRDLVDLVLITTHFELDATDTHSAITAEAGRRRLTLPTQLHTPDPSWTRNYPITASKTTLPTDLQALPAALDTAGRCLNPLLAGPPPPSTWQPHRQTWQPSTPTAAQRAKAAFPQPVRASTTPAPTAPLPPTRSPARPDQQGRQL